MSNSYAINQNREVETYWNLLKDASPEVKLRLITMLSQLMTASTLISEETEKSEVVRTGDFIVDFAGAWKGSETYEEIINNIRANRSV